MHETIIIPRKLEEEIKSMFYDKFEIIGIALGEYCEKGNIKVVDYFLGKGSEGTSALTDLPRNVLDEFIGFPFKRKRSYPLLYAHSHSRRIGDRIRKQDPYWSVGWKSAPQFNVGDIVENCFISGNPTGDNDYFKGVFDKFGINYTLFIHPREETKGQVMKGGNCKISAFKYNENRFGNIEEIGLSIE